MISNALSAFLDRVYSQEEPDDLYLRVRVGDSRRKSELVHSNIDILPDSESMATTIQGYLEGWVWDDGDRCFIELMRAKKTNPLDVVAMLPEDIVELEEEEPEEFVEESAVKTLTSALVELTKDANHRASVSQERFLGAVEVMVDAQIEMAHAQAQLAVEKEDTPAWITALSAISPAFGPLVGDIAQKIQAKQEEKPEQIEDKQEDGGQEPPATAEDKPPVSSSPRQPNPLDARG